LIFLSTITSLIKNTVAAVSGIGCSTLASDGVKLILGGSGKHNAFVRTCCTVTGFLAASYASEKLSEWFDEKVDKIVDIIEEHRGGKKERDSGEQDTDTEPAT
jgi:hypothetical protein